MRKTILILLLCAPLGWVVWREASRLLGDWFDGRTFAGLATLEKTDKSQESEAKRESDALARARGDVDKVLKLPNEYVRAAVALDDPPEALPGAGDTVGQVIAGLAEERRRGREKIEAALKEAADLESEIDAKLTSLRSGNDSAKPLLERLLNEYKKKSLRDNDKLESAAAEVDWPALERDHKRRDLDDLLEALDRWTPGGNATAALKTDAATHADAYRKYLDDHARVKERSPAAPRIAEARERYELWVRAAALVTVLKGIEENSAGRVTTAAPIRAVAEAGTTNNPPLRAVTTARRIARTLCAELLPREDLDPTVLFNDTGVFTRVPRSKLGIEWKDGGMTTLEKSGETEFTLKPEKVRSFMVSNTTVDLPRDGSPPLKETDYSKAVNAYNAERATVKWRTAEELSRLKTICERNRTELERDPGSTGKTLLTRINELLNVFQRYPEFFAVDAG